MIARDRKRKRTNVDSSSGQEDDHGSREIVLSEFYVFLS
jgi:hypothetical protein